MAQIVMAYIVMAYIVMAIHARCKTLAATENCSSLEVFKNLDGIFENDEPFGAITIQATAI